MSIDWSVKLNEISDLSDDELKDEEEEKRRENEINGMLASAFDDLSSVSGDEDDEDDNDDTSEDGSYDQKRIKTQYLNQNGDQNKANYLTSTPRFATEDEIRIKRYQPKGSPIKEVDENCTDALNTSNSLVPSSVASSIEKARGASLFSDNILNAFDNNNEHSSKHVQLLLDENEELRNESKNLQERLLSKSSDFDEIKYKQKQLEKNLKIKESEIITLNGKVNALEIQLKVESEAKSSLQRKQAVNEATIDTLEKQIADLMKNDTLARTRQNHEAFITKLRSDYESEIFNLNEELANLRWEMETCKQQIASNDELMKDKDLRIEELLREIKSLEDKLTELKNKQKEKLSSSSNEVENKLKTLQEENENLKRQLAEKNNIQLDLNSTKETSSLSDDQQQQEIENENKTKSSYDSIINELRIELERTLDTAELRRKQSKFVHDKLCVANKEIDKLKNSLKKKDEQIINLESLVNRNDFNDNNDVNALKRERDALRNTLETKDLLITRLKEYERKYYDCEKALSEKLNQIQQSNEKYQNLLKEKREIEFNYELLLNEVNNNDKENVDTNNFSNKEALSLDKIKDLVHVSSEMWKSDVERKFNEKFEVELAKLKETFSNNSSMVKNEIQTKLNEEINKLIDLVIQLIENGSDQFFKTNQTELHSIFTPLSKLWLEIVKAFKEKENILILKTNELNEARVKLEKALIESRINETSPNINENELCNNLKTELDLLTEKSTLLENKLLKYKKHYHLLLKKHENEIKNLKEQIISARQSELVNEKYHLDSESLIQQLTQRYIESLKEIKNHADNFLIESNKKSMEKISTAVLEYHKTIAKTISERENLLKSQLHNIVK